jgi:acyl-coenzyme A synthetase/AMP-(fatty) acid ligase
MPGVSVRVTQEALLCLRAPWLPDTEEWQTADRGELHADGTFSLHGRADRIVKVGEKRVSLTAIETRLAGSRLVREARVLLLQGGRTGAAIVLRPEGAALRDREGERRLAGELIRLLRPHVLAVGLPRRWRVVDALPRNEMGKVTDEAVRGLFGDR